MKTVTPDQYIRRTKLTMLFLVIVLHAAVLFYKENEESINKSFKFVAQTSSQKSIQVSLASKRQKKAVKKKAKVLTKKLSKKSKVKAAKKIEKSQAKTESVNSKAQTITANFEQSVLLFTKPAYPRLAQRRRMKGTTHLKLKVSKEGLPLDVILLSSSGHSILDKSAMKEAYNWRFKPITSLSTEYYWVTKPIVFKY